MIFPYWEELRDDEPRFLPLIPVTLHHATATTDTYALVDSGAEHSIFGFDMADELGFDLSNRQDVTIVGVGDNRTPGKATVVEYQIGQYRWTAPVIFSSAVNERPLLGQAGFFAFFTVTFRHARRDIEIRRNRTPRFQGWWHPEKD